jgi:hypothetical protein
VPVELSLEATRQSVDPASQSKLRFAGDVGIRDGWGNELFFQSNNHRAGL